GSNVAPVDVAFQSLTSDFTNGGNQMSVSTASVSGSPAGDSSPAMLDLTTANRFAGCNPTSGTVHVTGSVVGGPVHTATATLYSNVPSSEHPPSFATLVTPIYPAAQTVTLGGTTTYGVGVTSANTYAGQVTMSVPDLPAGMSATFIPGTQ